MCVRLVMWVMVECCCGDAKKKNVQAGVCGDTDRP